MRVVRCILFYCLLFCSQAMACSDDSDDSVESVVVGIDFTTPGHTTWGPIGAFSPSPSPSPSPPIESKEDCRRRKKRECEAKRRSKVAPKKKSKAAKKKAQTEKVQRHRSTKRAKSNTKATAKKDANVKQRDMAKRQADFAKRREQTRQDRIREAEEEGRLDDAHATCSSARTTTIPSAFPAQTSPPPPSQASTATVTPESTTNPNTEAEKSDETPSPIPTSRRTTLSDLLAPTPSTLFPVATNSKTHQSQPVIDGDWVPPLNVRTPPPNHFQATHPPPTPPPTSPNLCHPVDEHGVPFVFDHAAFISTCPTCAGTPETKYSYQEYQQLQKEQRMPDQSDVKQSEVSTNFEFKLLTNKTLKRTLTYPFQLFFAATPIDCCVSKR